MEVALVTCREKPEPDPDEEPLVAALRAAGLDARVRAWDDEGVDWERPRLAVLRSTWNYPHAPERFLDWAERAAAATALFNGPAVLRANLHKRYLLALEARGVPIAPTVLVRGGESTPLRAIADARGWDRVVVKPAISAASLLTERFDGAAIDGGDEHLRTVTSRGDALVQRYLPSVEGEGEREGERALVWIDGEFTHTVRKSPRLSGDDEAVTDPRPPTSEELELGEAALAWAPRPLLYARVDLARDLAGRLAVMELELMEPSLFLVQWPPALARFAGAIAERALEPRGARRARNG